MSTDRFVSMAVFVTVVESGSFSAASRLLGLSQSRVSKIIAALEARLGTRLINRTSRHFSLTEAGRLYVDKCRAAIAAADEADDLARLGQEAIRGTLRVNTATFLAQALVQPALLAFGEMHPELRIDIVAQERRIDPIKEGIDLLVRSSDLDDSSLFRRKAGSAKRGLFVSPDYLKRAGRIPIHPNELAGHDFVGGIVDGARVGQPLRLVGSDGDVHLIQTATRLAVSTGLLAAQASVMGAGIVMLPLFMIEDELVSGRLVQILPNYALPLMEVNLLHPFGRTPPRNVSVFIDFAIKRWHDGKQLGE